MSKKATPELFFNLPVDWKSKTNLVFDSGGSDIEAHLELTLSATEHKMLMASVEEYAEHFFNGTARSEAYWHKWARDNVMDKNVNTKIFDIMTARLFGWKNKEEKKKDKDDEKKPKKDAEKFGKKYGLSIAK